MLLATLAILGFCWALPLRNSVAFHDFETVFYVGIPLVFFRLDYVVTCANCPSRQSIAAVAVAALLLFVLSAAEMARIGHDDGEAAADAEMVPGL